MQYRKLGRTNLNVSFIGLGGLHLQTLSNVEAVKIIMKAHELGINFMDLGRSYISSEEKAGFVMQRMRDKFYIATKTHRRKGEDAARDVDISLEKLQTDYIDIYQLHQVDDLVTLDKILASGGAYEALRCAKRQGKIKYIGITGHSPAVLIKAITTGKFDTIQVLFNVVERESLFELIPIAQDMGIGILGMKPFGGGAFLEKESGIYQILSKNNGIAISTLLKFVSSFNISCMFVGVKTVKELERNVALMETIKPFSEKEVCELIKEIDNMISEERFCHRCGYCASCPQHIDIPLILRLDEYFHKYGSKTWASQQYKYIRQNAQKCIQCGACELKCPFKLPIRKMIRVAHERLTTINI